MILDMGIFIGGPVPILGLLNWTNSILGFCELNVKYQYIKWIKKGYIKLAWIVARKSHVMWSTEKYRRPSVGKGGQYGMKKREGEIEILGRGEEGGEGGV